MGEGQAHPTLRPGRNCSDVVAASLTLLAPSHHEHKVAIPFFHFTYSQDTLKDLDPSKAGDLDTLKKAMEDLFTLSDGQEPQ